MSVLTEPNHATEYFISEGNGDISRELVTLISGQNLGAGTVLGKITASGKYTILNTAGADGSETAAAILYAATDASAADKKCVVHIRDCEVNGDIIVYPGGISAPNKATAIANLALKGIIVR